MGRSEGYFLVIGENSLPLGFCAVKECLNVCFEFLVSISEVPELKYALPVLLLIVKFGEYQLEDFLEYIDSCVG